jgi:UDPglucose 6-dehydrogenase
MAALQPHRATEREPDPIRRVGCIGFGYVGRGTGHALGPVAEVAWHDPGVPGSRPLDDLVRWSEALLVCVPTPAAPTGAADLTILREVTDHLGALGVEAPVLIRSTTPPGTCADLSRRWPALRLVSNPEFLRERHHLDDASAPARVVLGWTGSVDEPDRDRVRALFTRRFPTTPRVELDSTEAELLKYASNALFGVKVSFANEMDALADRLGVSWESVRSALVLDPRVGDGHLAVPGPDGLRGFGGRCLPKDMAGLLAVAEDAGVELPVVTAALSANRRRRDP